jgi:ubiquinone/menaquinone biosynthesis C-methylase UbiE
MLDESRSIEPRDPRNDGARDALQRAPLRPGFAVPGADLGDLLGRIGNELFPLQPPLSRYVAWAHEYGLFEALEAHAPAGIAGLCACTPFNEAGLDSLLGVLCALGLTARSADGRYSLTQAARELCLRSSPFFIADQLSSSRFPVPPPYLRDAPTEAWDAQVRFMARQERVRFGSLDRLRNQHARNLGACVAAVRTGEFANVRCMLDVGGGSGTFAIPLALEYPQMRIVLTELPEALDNIRVFLAGHGLEERIELLGFDAFSAPWPVPGCDGVFIGNFLHGFDDAACIKVCREAYRHLCSGGTIWLHEIVWNDNRDGPMITALLNASMRTGGSGRQRTCQELAEILESAGFVSPRVVPTSGAFALVAARKPQAAELSRENAPIDRKRVPRDIARLGGKQPEDCAGDLFDAGNATDRNGRLYPGVEPAVRNR